MKIKKLLLPMFVAALLSTPVYADDITLEVNGQIIECDTPPQVVNGRALVPLRVVSEALGADVEWDGANKSVVVTKTGTTLCLTIGDPVMGRNNEPITLDTPAQIINGRTMVPLRAISECLGCTVNWNSERKHIRIDTDVVLNDFDDNLAAEIAERDAINKITSEPVTEEIWVSDPGSFGLIWVNPDWVPEGTKYIGKPDIKGNIHIYAFSRQSISGLFGKDNIIYVVDEMTEDFMNASDATGTFNGIRMMKNKGTLFFNQSDLEKLGIK